VFPREGEGLFERLDCTSTAGGRAELRRRFAAPLCRAAEIRDVQDAVRFLGEHPGPTRRLIETPGQATVDRYLDSRFATLSFAPGAASGARAAWTALRHPELVRHARSGLGAVASLAASVDAWCVKAREPDVPALLRNEARTLERAHSEVGADFPTDVAQAPANRLLRLDAELRTSRRHALRACLEGLHRLDALAALAEATRRLGGTLPEVLEGGSGPALEVTALRHPLLEAPVANDLEMRPDAPLILLTGPNMAGKTTFMRALGLSVVLAQIGMGVPATRMRLRPFDHLITGITPLDSVREGSSSFLSEIRRLRMAAEALASGSRSLLLFDEIFRGTNAEDALEASGQVIRAFSRCGDDAIVISSHASALVSGFAQARGVAMHYFDMEVKDGAPSFDYRLRDGAFTGRLAQVLIRQEGLTDVLARLTEEERR
jgi:DNA mismatch repair ATPase MutS